MATATKTRMPNAKQIERMSTLGAEPVAMSPTKANAFRSPALAKFVKVTDKKCKKTDKVTCIVKLTAAGKKHLAKCEGGASVVKKPAAKKAPKAIAAPAPAVAN